MADKAKDNVLVRYEPWICAGVVLLCLIPFLGKPFHIDDPLFVWAGRHMQDHPFNFFGFRVNWNGYDQPMWIATKNPPLACGYIALAGSVLGFSELALHSAFLLPAVAVALGCYYLARRWCSRPMIAALAAVLTPGFLVAATNVMCDVLMTAFWVWAMYFWVSGIQSQKPMRLLIAAVLASLCPLTKYYGAALPVVLAVYSICRHRRLTTSLLFLLIPIAVMGAYQWVTFRLYGHGLFTAAADYTSQSKWHSAAILTRPLMSLAFIGGCAVSIVFFSTRLWSLAGLMAIVGAAIMLPPAVSLTCPVWVLMVQFVIVIAGGIAVMVLAVEDCRRCKSAESVVLLLWVLGTFVFTAYVNWDVNARSILPMIPAVGILIARGLDRRLAQRRLLFRQWVLPLVLAGATTLAVCRADYSLASATRQAATTICEKYQGRLDQMIFQGHWGFQYYMQQNGAKPFDFKVPLRPGLWVATPFNNYGARELPANISQKELSFQFEVFPWAGTMCQAIGAGFYASDWGPMPFAFMSTPPEEYGVYRIK